MKNKELSLEEFRDKILLRVQEEAQWMGKTELQIITELNQALQKRMNNQKQTNNPMQTPIVIKFSDRADRI